MKTLNKFRKVLSAVLVSSVSMSLTFAQVANAKTNAGDDVRTTEMNQITALGERPCAEVIPQLAVMVRGEGQTKLEELVSACRDLKAAGNPSPTFADVARKIQKNKSASFICGALIYVGVVALVVAVRKATTNVPEVPARTDCPIKSGQILKNIDAQRTQHAEIQGTTFR